MNEYVAQLERELALIERGFKEEQRRAQADYHSFDREHAKALAHLAYRSQVYQVRMYAVFLLGHLSQEEEILNFLRDEVSKDDNWRVQEVLAKAVDEFCATRGYEQALGVIDEWLNDSRHMCGEPLLKVYGFGRVVRTSEITHVKQSRDYRGFEVIAASMFAGLWEMPCGILVRNSQTWLQRSWACGACKAGK